MNSAWNGSIAHLAFRKSRQAGCSRQVTLCTNNGRQVRWPIQNLRRRDRQKASARVRNFRGNFRAGAGKWSWCGCVLLPPTPLQFGFGRRSSTWMPRRAKKGLPRCPGANSSPGSKRLRQLGSRRRTLATGVLLHGSGSQSSGPFASAACRPRPGICFSVSGVGAQQTKRLPQIPVGLAAITTSPNPSNRRRRSLSPAPDHW